ncbi:MAG: hypothetical protein JW741_11595 [Sedimentisphaerales bacterium]|nr:hypothetical protein [Sedimentisphaerales bacterium]
MSRRSLRVRSSDILIIGLLIGFVFPCASLRAGLQSYETLLPSLNTQFSPLDQENLPVLYQRLVTAFALDYAAHLTANQDRQLSEGMTVYYLRQELQAMIDIWWATGDIAYLDQATDLTFRAIRQAVEDSRPLIWHEEYRGDWPCFYLDTVAEQTGGHSQLCDFQGSAGFLNVARLLQLLNRPESKKIADFVEEQVIEKWLYYKPTITKAYLTGDRSYEYLLAILNSGRDVREHFACICMDLHELGCRGYPYDKWAKLLIDVYLAQRQDANEPAPCEDKASGNVPANWGLFPRSTSEGINWLWVPNYDPAVWDEVTDTSHANRVAWLAAKAYAEGYVDRAAVDGLINTLSRRVWAPEKGPFYFNNYVDGSDGAMGGLPGGRGGNVWFGWHRLAAYDATLRTLFLSLACDLTTGGSQLPAGAQNRTMLNAQTCLEAWAARLLAEKGHPELFP